MVNKKKPVRVLHAVAISVVIAIATGCANGPVQTHIANPAWQFTTIEGALWAQNISGDRYRLPVDGQQYFPLPSPDNAWVAVEVQLMSNLRTLRVFRHTSSGFKETKRNAASYLWQLARDNDAIDTDNIRNPAIRVVNWHPSSQSLEVELRGETTDDGQYKKIHKLPIAELQQ